MDDRQGFGYRIKAARENRRLTAEKAAELCDASESIWKQYERGDRLPSLPKLKKMCIALRVQPEYLLGPELAEMQEDLNRIEQLKLKIGQLHPNDIDVIDAAVSRRLEIRKTIEY